MKRARLALAFVAVSLTILLHASAASADERQTAGVGLALSKKGDELVVTRVMPSSPAAVDDSIKEGDRILSIAEDKQPPVEVKALKLEEAVALIRGPKGSTIWLTVVAKGNDDAQARSISFVRGELKELARWGDGVTLPGGTPAPQVPFVRLADTKPEMLAEHLGKIVVLEFWAISCGPCQKHVADLQGYRAKYPAWKDKVLLVTVDVDEDQAAAKKHLETQGWNTTHNLWADSAVLQAFHVRSLPTLYVVDEAGKVVAVDSKEDIPAIVNRLIERR